MVMFHSGNMFTNWQDSVGKKQTNLGHAANFYLVSQTHYNHIQYENTTKRDEKKCPPSLPTQKMKTNSNLSAKINTDLQGNGQVTSYMCS